MKSSSQKLSPLPPIDYVTVIANRSTKSESTWRKRPSWTLS
jgi:hypothetical protein